MLTCIHIVHLKAVFNIANLKMSATVNLFSIIFETQIKIVSLFSFFIVTAATLCEQGHFAVYTIYPCVIGIHVYQC